MDENVLSLVISADSEVPVLDLEARSANSSDQNEELMLSAADSEGLDVDKLAGSSAEQLPQSATFEELLEVVSFAVAKSKLDWPDEMQVVRCKLDDHFLTSAHEQPAHRHLLFFPDLHTEVLRS